MIARHDVIVERDLRVERIPVGISVFKASTVRGSTEHRAFRPWLLALEWQALLHALFPEEFGSTASSNFLYEYFFGHTA